ncbi:hypothetical protein FB451DRAFT_1399385 [Mycena latifolia]|nr:hypothetical protein FB451DRAFT_1399385 [Mycena latifolia]
MAHSHCSRRPRRPHLNIRMLCALRQSQLARIRHFRSPADQYLALAALGVRAYRNDGPGHLYTQFRVAPEFLEQYLAGTLPHDILHSGVWLEIKLGHTKNLKRRLRQYEACQANDHQISFWGYCPVPRQMLAERLVHLRLGALGARLVPYPCPGCGVEHREFFPLAAAGGCNGVKSVVKTVVEELGGRFQCFSHHQTAMAAPAPKYVDITPEPERQKTLSLLRRLAPRDPMGATDAYEALRPYLEPAGGGCVYVFLQPNEEIAVQAGTAPLGEEVDALDAKVGYAVDVEAPTESGLRTDEPGSIKVLNVQVEFATEGGMVGGAWSLPSTVPAMPQSALRHAQEDRKREDEQCAARAVKQGLRLKGTEVIVIGINEGNRKALGGAFQTHAAKGAVGVIIDVHERTVASGSSSSAGPMSSSLVFTVKQELTDQIHQVPELLLRHRWTGLTLRDFGIVSPWARPLNWTWWKDGSSWKDSDWAAGRRTPPLETSSPGPSAPRVEPPPAREIGDDGGSWLCIPRLKGKRVDVKVMNKTRGRVSAVQSQAVGNHGYIEPVDALTESQLNTPIAVYVYFKDRQKEKKVMLEPRWLTPMRQTLCPPHMEADVSIVERRGRVVIIGPSDSGDRSRMGEYGETIPESSADAVWVRLEGRSEPTARFPVQSLC